jgi:hypothetical protein
MTWPELARPPCSPPRHPSSSSSWRCAQRWFHCQSSSPGGSPNPSQRGHQEPSCGSCPHQAGGWRIILRKQDGRGAGTSVDVHITLRADRGRGVFESLGLGDVGTILVERNWLYLELRRSRCRLGNRRVHCSRKRSATAANRLFLLLPQFTSRHLVITFLQSVDRIGLWLILGNYITGLLIILVGLIVLL